MFGLDVSSPAVLGAASGVAGAGILFALQSLAPAVAAVVSAAGGRFRKWVNARKVQAEAAVLTLEAEVKAFVSAELAKAKAEVQSAAVATVGPLEARVTALEATVAAKVAPVVQAAVAVAGAVQPLFINETK